MAGRAWLMLSKVLGLQSVSSRDLLGFAGVMKQDYNKKLICCRPGIQVGVNYCKNSSGSLTFVESCDFISSF